MPLGMEVGLGPGDCVRWGPSSSPKGGGAPPIFGPCLLWPNGWIDQDATWHGGGPRSRPHCARWRPSSPPQKGGVSPQFSVHFYCGLTALCIKMPLGVNLGLGPGHIVLDGDPAPPQKKGHSPLHQEATWYVRHLPRAHCARWGHSSPKKGAQAPPIFGTCLLWLNGCID